MPVRALNREQTWLLPPNLDELIARDHPARFVAMIVDSMNTQTWHKLEIKLEGDPLGAPTYNPRAMLCIWLYGFMTGVHTSRKLEAACRDQIPYLWLTAWQHPDHNSIWRFYKAHRQEMRQMFKLTVKTAVKMNLIDLAVQAIDGTKIAANAALDRTYSKEGLRKLLDRIDKRIEDLEKENEAGTEAAPVHLPEKLQKAEQLKEEVKAALQKLDEEEKRKSINLTDEDPKIVKTRQGVKPGYNVEAAVSPVKEGEKKNVLITAIDTITETTDNHQLIPMIQQSAENAGEKAEVSLADAGYHSGSNLADCEEMNQNVVMPDAAAQKLDSPYHKDKFIYDQANNVYTCPFGQTLKYRKITKINHSIVKVYGCDVEICRSCPAFGQCTRDYKHGRELKIGPYERQLRQHREKMNSAEAKEIYRLRKGLIEPVFGIIKEQMNIRRLWLRGLKRVRTEVSIIGAAFNMRTLYSIWSKRSEQSSEKWIEAVKAAGEALAG